MTIDEKILNDRLSAFNALPADAQMDLKRSLYEHILGMNIKTDIDGTSGATPEAIQTIRSFFAGKDSSNPSTEPPALSDRAVKSLIAAYEEQGVDITMPRDQLRQTFEDRFKDPMFIINVRKGVFARGEEIGQDLSAWVTRPGLSQEEADRRHFLFDTFIDAAVQRGREDKFTEKDISYARDIFAELKNDAIDTGRGRLNPEVERENAQSLLMGIMCVGETDENGNPLFTAGGKYEQLLNEVDGRSNMLAEVVNPFSFGHNINELSCYSTPYIRGRDMLSDYLAQGMDYDWSDDERKQYLTTRASELFNISEDSAGLLVDHVRPQSLQENGAFLGHFGFTREKVGELPFRKACDAFTLGPFQQWAYVEGYGTDFKAAFEGFLDHERSRLKGRESENLTEKLLRTRDGNPVPGLQGFIEESVKKYDLQKSAESKADREWKFKRDAIREAPGRFEGFEAKLKDNLTGIAKAVPDLIDNPDKAIVELFSKVLDLVIVNPLESIADRQEKIAKSYGKALQKWEDDAPDRKKEDLKALEESRIRKAQRIADYGGKDPIAMDLSAFAQNVAKHSGGNLGESGRPVIPPNVIGQQAGLEQDKGANILSAKRNARLDQIIKMKMHRGQQLSDDQLKYFIALGGEMKNVGLLGKALDLSAEFSKKVDNKAITI